MVDQAQGSSHSSKREHAVKEQNAHLNKETRSPSQFQAGNEKKVGESFFKQGELRLLHGDPSGLHFFELSLQLEPKNAQLHYKQGLCLLEYGSEKGNEKSLLTAAKRFKAATKLKNDYFEAWHAWGNTLHQLGNHYSEHHYFLEAEDKYKQALKLSKNQHDDVMSDLYWNYGCVWAEIADNSKEASDMKLSIDSFEKTLNHCNDQSTDFWHDYGNACMKLGHAINDLSLFYKAIDCFKNAVSIQMSSFESWKLLASSLKLLYSFTHDEDHFNQSNECFSTATQINSKDSELWLTWAKLLNESGRQIKDTKRIRSCIEKCHKAFNCDGKNLGITATWAEALSTLGLLQDKVNFIHDALNKISDVQDDEAKSPDLLHAYAVCLFSLGKYFSDIDYFYQAIEKFQEGLSIDRTLHKLWHGLGYAYTQAALLEEDNKIFERAHKFYEKAITLHGCSLYYYNYGFSLLKQGEIDNSQQLLRSSLKQFEAALSLQKNAMYLHPDWFFHYGVALDLLGGFDDEKPYYDKSLEVLNHVLMVDPEYPDIHYQLALTNSHLGDLSADSKNYQKALHHYRLANKRKEEDDQIILDWALTLTALADLLDESREAAHYFREAEFKMTQAAKLGNTHAYYHLACLYSLLKQFDEAMRFIQKADEYDALPSPQELQEDDWLENLRSDPNFISFLTYLENKTRS